MLNGRFAEACKTFFMATMFAALIQGVSAQSYSMKEKTYGSGSASSVQPTTGTQFGQAMMSASTQFSGSIASISGATLFVTLGDGRTLAVALGASTEILKRARATLDSIKPGDALGVAATKSADGSLIATAINVFSPQVWQRVRKGQFPMADGQVMTNAQVERLGNRVDGSTLYLKYEMLSAAILVPATATIRRSLPVSPAELAPGMAVTLRGTSGADGIFSATLVSFDGP
ncbi:MAG TPA: DUF5666 domain-containing protein [Rectinemataceae bacterium]|nr:DUF5666 domain-containing protein [Rectinemataceae bacterium]